MVSVCVRVCAYMQHKDKPPPSGKRHRALDILGTDFWSSYFPHTQRTYWASFLLRSSSRMDGVGPWE